MLKTIGQIVKGMAIEWALKSAGSEQNRLFRGSSRTQSTNFKNSKDYLDAYQLVNYVSHSVGIVSDDIASLEWELVDKQGQEATDLEIENLLREPMQGMTWPSWIFRTTQHLLLDGNAFWLIDQTNALAQFRGNPNELKILSPALVDIHDRDAEEVKSTTRKITTGVGFYRVNINNSIVQIQPENICQTQIPSPHNTLRGMGRIQSNQGIMDAERLTTLFNNMFFKQGARMSYAITPDAEMGPKEFAIYDKNIREKYEGQDNLTKIYINPPGSKIQTLNVSQKDIEFLEQRKLTRQDIYSFFNIPPIISGNLDLAKYDSAGEQSKIYYDLVLPRTYRILEASLNKVIREMNPNVFFRFIPKNSIDKEKANAISKDMFDRGAITGNEYRERVGMPLDLDTPSLDLHWVSSNLLPAESAATLITEDVQEPEEAKIFEAVVKAPLEAPHTKATKGQLALHLRARQTKFKIEKNFMRMTRKFYKSMEARVLADVKNFDISHVKQTNIDEVFDFSEEFQEAKKAANSTFQSATALAIEDVNGALGSSVSATTQNPQVVLVVEKLNTRYADETINSRREELRVIIQKSIDEGTGVSGLKSDLQTYFRSLNGSEAWRATRIARTEASHAWDLAAEIGYRELGVTTVDVVGCEDTHGQWDCNKGGFPISQIPQLNLHPNHTGSVVPANI